LIKSIILIYY